MVSPKDDRTYTEVTTLYNRGAGATIDALIELRRRRVDQLDVAKQKPVGCWLKHADEVVTSRVDRVLSDNGFTRSRWQVPNIV